MATAASTLEGIGPGLDPGKSYPTPNLRVVGQSLPDKPEERPIESRSFLLPTETRLEPLAVADFDLAGRLPLINRGELASQGLYGELMAVINLHHGGQDLPLSLITLPRPSDWRGRTFNEAFHNQPGEGKVALIADMDLNTLQVHRRLEQSYEYQLVPGVPTQEQQVLVTHGYFGAIGMHDGLAVRLGTSAPTANRINFSKGVDKIHCHLVYSRACQLQVWNMVPEAGAVTVITGPRASRENLVPHWGRTSRQFLRALGTAAAL